MYMLHAPALVHLLSPLAMRSHQPHSALSAALGAVNGSMDVFYPVFDDHLQVPIACSCTRRVPTRRLQVCLSLCSCLFLSVRSQLLTADGGRRARMLVH